MLRKHEANAQENNNGETRSQQSRFATLLKLHPRTDTPPKTEEQPPWGENLWGIASASQKNIKRLKL